MVDSNKEIGERQDRERRLQFYITFTFSNTRLLEVDGSDVGGKSSEEVGKLLSACQGTARLVVSRALHTEYDPGSPGGMVIARFKRLSASLSTQLDTQSAQTDHWRLECER